MPQNNERKGADIRDIADSPEGRRADMRMEEANLRDFGRKSLGEGLPQGKRPDRSAKRTAWRDYIRRGGAGRK